MFVGHALLAFALVAGAAGHVGRDRRRALSLGLVAGAFAVTPDVDVAYAVVGVAAAGVAPPLALAEAFWSTGNVVHRGVTHSVLVAPVAAVAAAAWTAGWRGRRVAGLCSLGAVAALVALVALVSGPLAAAVVGLFCVAVLGVATLAARCPDVGARAVLVAALAGLLTHPFGDLFTGTPPALLYPLDLAPVSDRVVLAADPTLHLLAAFGLELATAWLAVLVAARVAGVRVLPAARATVGVGYAAALPVLPAPTLDLSYPFVFGAVGVGLAVLAWEMAGRPRAGATDPSGPPGGRSFGSGRRHHVACASLTGLTTVTLAWAAYAATYLAV